MRPNIRHLSIITIVFCLFAINIDIYEETAAAGRRESGFTLLNARGEIEHPFVVDGEIYLVREDDLASRPLALPHKVEALYAIAPGGSDGAVLYYGTNGREVMARTDEWSGFDLYGAYMDGSTRQIMDGQAVVRAMWSKQGRFLLIWTRDMELFMLPEGELNPRRIATHAAAPDISPDGRSIAYAKLPDSYVPGSLPEQLTLSVIDLESGVERALAGDQDATEPLWSPDGERIIFISGGRAGLSSFWSVNRDGSGLTQLTNQGQAFVTEQTVPLHRGRAWWSNDGHKLLWSRVADNGADEVWMLDFQRNEYKPEAAFIAAGGDPRWSSDGKGILYVRKQDVTNRGAGMLSFTYRALGHGIERRQEEISSEPIYGVLYGPEAAPPIDLKRVMSAPVDNPGHRPISGIQPQVASRYSWPLDIYPGFSAYYDNNASSGERDWKCGTRTYNGHKGTDIAVAVGNPVRNGDRGSVASRNDGCDTYGFLGSTCGGGFGNYVKLNNDTGWASAYAHMQRGTVVGFGTYACRAFLGRSGGSGNSSGPHLHFQVYHSGYPYDDPFGGSCSGPTSFWVNQNGGSPTKGCQ